MCKTPAKVAHWLKNHGQMKKKWLPIQAVNMLYNSCAFVVLSGNVTHEDRWKKWRCIGKPENWIIMTMVEHTKRTQEYLQLLNESRIHSKGNNHTSATVRNIDNQPSSNIVVAQDDIEPVAAQKGRRKRKRKQSIASTDHSAIATDDSRARKRKA